MCNGTPGVNFEQKKTKSVWELQQLLFLYWTLCNAIYKCYWVTYFFTYSGGKNLIRISWKQKKVFYIHWKKDVINSIKWKHISTQETQFEGPIIFFNGRSLTRQKQSFSLNEVIASSIKGCTRTEFSYSIKVFLL